MDIFGMESGWMRGDYGIDAVGSSSMALGWGTW